MYLTNMLLNVFHINAKDSCAPLPLGAVTLPSNRKKKIISFLCVTLKHRRAVIFIVGGAASSLKERQLK
jgi:hypothetical protein